MSSTRLPGKVLKDLPFGSGISVLEQVIRRLKKTKASAIIVATTTNIEDEKIVQIANKENVFYYRGSMDNVLERYFLAAKKNNLDIIIRITSDCPCIDPQIVDQIIDTHIENKSDYTSNTLCGFPRGLDVEMFNFSTLEIAYKEAKTRFEKEHVTPYIYQTNPHIFKIMRIKPEKTIEQNKIRITLDTIEDYALLCIIFDYLYENDRFFDIFQIISLFKKKPWLKYINSSVKQKHVFKNFNDEINEGIKLLNFQGLYNVKKILEDYKNESIPNNRRK